MSVESDSQEVCECCGTQLALGEDRICDICREGSVGSELDDDSDNTED